MHEPLLIDNAREYSQEIESILIERARGFAGLHFPDGDGHEIPFVEHIRRRCAAAQLVLLLHAAPNLDILNLRSLDWDPCAQLLGMIHASNSLPNLPPPLSKLRSLVLSAIDDPFFDLSQWSSVVRMPSLRRLHAYAPIGDLGSGNAILSIQQLHLINTFQDYSDIYNILQACRTLREIKISHDASLILGNSYTRPYQCLEHLQQCADTLEILDWPFEIHLCRNLIGLTSFTKRRVAKVAICALFTPGIPPDDLWENSPYPYTRGYLVTTEALEGCFPASIEDVTFYSCARSAGPPDTLSPGLPPSQCEHQYHSKMNVLLDFAIAAVGRLTRLKKVTYCHNFPDIAGFWVTKVSDVFSAIGVQFQVQRGDRYERLDRFNRTQLDN